MALEGEKYLLNVSNFSESTVKNVTVIHYTSKKMSIPVRSRKQTTFMYVAKGTYHYTSDNLSFYAEAGDTVYVPRGAHYTYTIISSTSECLQVEFDAVNGEGELLRLTSVPFVHKGDSEKFEPVFRKMLLDYRENSYAVNACIYTLLSFFDADMSSEKLEKSGEYRIAPAVKYIRENFRKKIYVSELADLCGFSEPHLRRLFKLYIGKSPAEYKADLISSAASDMLLKSDLSITDLAYDLGFPDVYTFSQFFKRKNGLSPRDFINKYRK